MYARRGYGSGDMGAPTGNAYRLAGSTQLQQDFENSKLWYSGGTIGLRVRTNPLIQTVTAADVPKTYRAGCPVAPAQLRKIWMNYLNYDGQIKRGLLIVRDNNVQRTVTAFTTSTWNAFPIHQMRPVDVFGGDDPTSMAANNTSGFNCRKVVGNPYAISPHSYGTAVDINTVQNPYNDGKTWWPKNGTYWITHRSGKGVMTGSDPTSRAMVANGYFWGANWAARDYHHFQVGR